VAAQHAGFRPATAWSQGEIRGFASLPDVDFCSGEILVKSLQRVPDVPEQPLPAG